MSNYYIPTIKNEFKKQINKFSLTFSDEGLEKEYLEYHFESFKKIIFYGLILAAVSVAFFSILDYILVPDERWLNWTIRFFIIIPTLLFLSLSYKSSYFKKYYQFLIQIEALIIGFGFIIMIINDPQPANYLYYAGIIQVLFYNYSFMGARFVFASVGSGIIVLGYILISIFLLDFPQGINYNNIFFIISSDFIGMAIAYAIERMSRHKFYLEKIIMKERQKVEKALEKEKELNMMKTAFLRMVGHQYKNPLSIISMSNDIIKELLENNINEKMETYFSYITASIDKLNNMMEKVIFLTKNQDREITNFKELNFKKLIENKVEELKIIDNNSHNIVIDFDSSIENIYSDEFCLEHIVDNLISNALKYSDSNTTVTITGEKNGKDIIFKIQDQGYGIPDEEQSHIFETFYRATTGQDINGTGVGLSIVKNFISKLKGEISFKSKVGDGSTFIVKFPNNKN